MSELGKYNLNDISNSFFNNGFSKEIDLLQEEIDERKKELEEVRLYFDNLIELKKKDYFNKQDEKTLISLNYNENDKYHLFLTTKRSLVIKEKLKKVKNIVINNINIKIDDIKFKNQSSSTKINFSYLRI